MWVKMNLFYQQASEQFGQEEFFSEVSIKSPLDMLGENFTRQEFYDVLKKTGLKTEPSNLLALYVRRHKVKMRTKNDFSKTNKQTHTQYLEHKILISIVC